MINFLWFSSHFSQKQPVYNLPPGVKSAAWLSTKHSSLRTMQRKVSLCCGVVLVRVFFCFAILRWLFRIVHVQPPPNRSIATHRKTCFVHENSYLFKNTAETWKNNFDSNFEQFSFQDLWGCVILHFRIVSTSQFDSLLDTKTVFQRNLVVHKVHDYFAAFEKSAK